MAKTQDYGLGEFTYPRGWFMVADSAKLEAGAKPLNERYFGEDVVIYRGDSGAVAMLDAYCPHMNSHLGKSTLGYSALHRKHVEGDSIRCPYHGWRFGADGKCNDIPFLEGRIPDRAKVRSWHVVERYGIVFCWHDPEGLAPNFDLPPFPEWDDPHWVRWDVDYMGTLQTHPQEVIDNGSDIRHLTFVHGVNVQFYENEVRGPILHQRVGGIPLAEGPVNYHMPTLTTEVAYFGPGILTSRYISEGASFGAQIMLNTPIEDGVTRMWQASMMKSSKPAIDDEDRTKARTFSAMLVRGFQSDFEIWENKKPAINIMQVPSDGPFAKSRIWYKQFYNPRAKTADLLSRAQGLHTAEGCPSREAYAAE